MSIKTQPVTTVLKRLICDNCGKEMERNLNALLSSPSKNVYTCSCGNSETHSRAFPAIVFIDENGKEVAL